MRRIPIMAVVLSAALVAGLSAKESTQAESGGGFPCWRCVWDNWDWPPRQWCIPGFHTGAVNCVSGTGWCAEIDPDACFWTGVLRTEDHQMLADGALWSTARERLPSGSGLAGLVRREVRSCSGVILAAFYSAAESVRVRDGLRRLLL